jgi:hypothetical protein
MIVEVTYEHFVSSFESVSGTIKKDFIKCDLLTDIIHDVYEFETNHKEELNIYKSLGEGTRKKFLRRVLYRIYARGEWKRVKRVG